MLNISEFGQVSKNHDAGHDLTVMGLFPLQEGDEFSLVRDWDLHSTYSGSFETWAAWPNTGHSKSQLQTEEAHVSPFSLEELQLRKSSGRYFQGAHSSCLLNHSLKHQLDPQTTLAKDNWV